MKDPIVLFEDNHLLAVGKPAGMPVQGDETGDEPLVEWARAYIRKKYSKPGEVFCGLVHRLDRPVSGLVMFAKTSKALARMNEIFRDRSVQKTYLAVVDPRPQNMEGHLTDYLLKTASTNTSRRVSPAHKQGSKAELDYRILAQHEKGWLLEVNPLTGRHHQIRVQLSGMGSPIVGDVKYGSRAKYKPGLIMLHAWKLVFEHPVRKERMEVECPPTF